MLLVFFTNPEYGMNWFEGAGLGSLPSNAPFWDRFWETASHLILTGFLSDIRLPGIYVEANAWRNAECIGSGLHQDGQEQKAYRTKKVVWKHAFRNALFPLITIFARVFPAAVAGSVSY